MAWVVPPTFVANSPLTAADLNSSLRDCMDQTMPAKALTPGGFFVGTAVNTIAERSIAQGTVSATETRTSTAFGDLTTVGPAVTLTTGTKAMVVVTAQLSNNTLNSYAIVSYAVSGSTTIAASDSFALTLQSGGSSQYMATSHVSHQNLNAGSNTFTLKYRVTSGTGTFLRRRILVWPF